MYIQVLPVHTRETRWITNITLESLDGHKIYTKNNTKISGLDGWYLLTTSNIPIKDILINNESIREIIHASYTKNNIFHIWIHTNLGYMFSRCRKDIISEYFDKDLYNKYMLTVDRPITFKHSKLYSESVNSFFKNADGPHWWKDNLPYKIFTTPTVNKDEMLRKFESQLKYKDLDPRNPGDKHEPGWTFQTLKPKDSKGLPLINLNKINNKDAIKLFRTVGYTSILNISIATLAPFSYISIHIDDSTNKNLWQYKKGCKKLYYSFSSNKNVYFKFNEAGLVPLDNLLLVNTSDYVHSVVNDSNSPRKVLICYGNHSI